MSSFARLDYHIVLVAKYRKPVFRGIEKDVESAFVNATRGGHFEILEFACDEGDHVHLVVRADPSVSVSQLVRRLKQLTTLELWSKHKPSLKKHYWKRKRLLWSSGYFASTVGDVSKSTVLEYVKKQKH